MLQRLRHDVGAQLMSSGDQPSGDRFTLRAYRRCLERLRGFYDPLERDLAALPGWASTGLDLGARRKVPLLDRDLLDLGCADPTQLAACPDLPMLESLECGVGCLFVLESAAESSRVVSRHFQYLRPISPEFGGRLLHGYAERRLLMWREFGVAAARVGGSPNARERIVRAAAETLGALRRWTEAEGSGDATDDASLVMRQWADLLGNR